MSDVAQVGYKVHDLDPTFTATRPVTHVGGSETLEMVARA